MWLKNWDDDIYYGIYLYIQSYNQNVKKKKEMARHDCL